MYHSTSGCKLGEAVLKMQSSGSCNQETVILQGIGDEEQDGTLLDSIGGPVQQYCRAELEEGREKWL
jgi:hypothetical protein